jgi:hypothetical protein
VVGSTAQIDPLIATAIVLPSGDHAGAQGVDEGAGAK